MKNIFKKKGNLHQNTETISLKINGMTCSGCSSHIEKDMNKTNGILSSAVNHETGKGEFTIDKNKMNKEELINAVNSVGNYSVINSVDKKDCCASN
ncbi:MAG: heavy-metal-associated domain-containing protein, partial [Lutibacter sp.]|nr:heavy-metal-associated domain-containing protein [Lutibacter sp.]